MNQAPAEADFQTKAAEMETVLSLRNAHIIRTSFNQGRFKG